MNALSPAGFIQPSLPAADYEYFFRMMYRQFAGPYRLFEHTNCIIRQTALTARDYHSIDEGNKATHAASPRRTATSNGVTMPTGLK